jgi:hypothetical protein
MALRESITTPSCSLSAAKAESLNDMAKPGCGSHTPLFSNRGLFNFTLALDSDLLGYPGNSSPLSNSLPQGESRALNPWIQIQKPHLGGDDLGESGQLRFELFIHGLRRASCHSEPFAWCYSEPRLFGAKNLAAGCRL